MVRGSFYIKRTSDNDNKRWFLNPKKDLWEDRIDYINTRHLYYNSYRYAVQRLKKLIPDIKFIYQDFS
jgi:hypothetical protein